MQTITYILKGFGFESVSDFSFSLFGMAIKAANFIFIGAILTLGFLRSSLPDLEVLDFAVYAVFVMLIFAEFYTGVKVARIKKKEKIKSRKVGRMLLKIGVYTFILFCLNILAQGIQAPPLFGLDINPLEWLYYTVLIGIIFQLVLSYLENLACLGYKEDLGLFGFLLRKYNKFFEFDGEKDNGIE